MVTPPAHAALVGVLVARHIAWRWARYWDADPWLLDWLATGAEDLRSRAVDLAACNGLTAWGYPAFLAATGQWRKVPAAGEEAARCWCATRGLESRGDVAHEQATQHRAEQVAAHAVTLLSEAGDAALPQLAPLCSPWLVRAAWYALESPSGRVPAAARVEVIERWYATAPVRR